ncbi:hypothetical protein WE348_23065 (plasmid) [Alteromonas macleodii]|uniref:Prepilin-type N-terminal cleavage/methylation domain-containing protein n=1 Tax=Alteromonas macleodii TaxID=28108 RepID=A0AB36FKX1_ALTMA|nr:hypothetical protein [Alteromonas macleodii]OES24334.1 hypothetical protein BFV94_4831 [Alteromonas macleodii]OES24671.1 hypothetical protein BFV95_4697 [Alteromonas macleodii]OES24939.1 hypothetical protein BFV93_4648 [Alteromonas macleodii]OES38559.1 hypothetical protein BFV96_4846 [Alteromonas macleodii]|tara:strand:+ start:1309 stop:1755 length:447 start_codon:yes stop_codon:yes gene_type:complete
MLNNRRLSKQKGMTTVDWLITIAGIAAITVYFSGKSESAGTKTDESMIYDTFNHIVESARNAKQGQTDGYASLDIEFLSTNNYISPAYGDGTGSNPKGGDWNLDGSTVSTLVVSATGLSDELCGRLASKFNRWSTAACTSGTVTLTTN